MATRPWIILWALMAIVWILIKGTRTSENGSRRCKAEQRAEECQKGKLRQGVWQTVEAESEEEVLPTSYSPKGSSPRDTSL